jgi:alpha-aminoadipate/glutamate carrier protein LysW
LKFWYFIVNIFFIFICYFIFPMTTKCPKCDANLNLSDDVEVGEIITCDECSAELEVKSLDPIELVDAPEVEEDWGE